MLPGNYRVEVHTEAGDVALQSKLTVSAKKAPATKIESVFPSSKTIPENTLKFYVHFSAAMRKGDIYQFLKLREQGGKDIELPFLEIEQEFWSRNSKRLTLLLDPGRIKRGLQPREEMGPILEAGKTYELVISGNWPDASGTKLADGEDFVHTFKATEEDHGQPSLASWKIDAPKPGSREPLVIRFPDSLDSAMLLRSIQVFQDGKDQPITGKIKLSKQETFWSFTADEPWESGDYRIEVDPNLEDLCGNSVARQFDVDVFQKTESTNDVENAQLEFKIAK